MIDRKIWKGDVLNLAEGNSFWGNEVVHHRAGSALVMQDSEVGDTLVEISGGYTVKRSDLFELSERELKVCRIVGQLMFPEALNGVDKEERKALAEQLRELGGCA